ncbi:MAG: hypothetical protein GY861_23105 [bacterium]|nr:hypothetical protein [bacterium]
MFGEQAKKGGEYQARRNDMIATSLVDSFNKVAKSGEKVDNTTRDQILGEVIK